MSATPEIGTKFSLGGLKEAQTGFGRLAAGAKSSLGTVKTAAGEALKPMEKDIDRAKRSLRGLQTVALTTGRVGFGALKTGAGAAFSAIKIGAVSATVALGGIGAAAAKAANDSSQAMDRIAKDARRLGMSTEDVSVLGFAAEREGVNPEEALKGVARIGSEWAKIRQQIAASNTEFTRMQTLAKNDAIVSLLQGDRSGLQSAADSVASARSGSLDATRQRIAQIESQLSGLDTISAGRADPRQQIQRQVAVMALRRELSDLQAAQASITKGFGPVGEAMFGLQDYGLNIERASKGGMEGLMALGDAIRNVQDPMERLRYSSLIFGQEAGPKMLNLLMAGQEGMAAYRKEAERLGIVVSAEQARMAEAHEDAKTNFARSRKGLEMELGTVLLPSMTKATKSITDYVTANRKGIAAMVKVGFEATGNLAKDAIDLFNGRDRNLRTEWLQTLVDKVRQARRLWSEFKAEIRSVMNGGGSRWPWLDTVAKGIRDAIDLGKDLWAILMGEDAVRFPWLNKLRDDVMAVVKAVMDYVVYFGEKLKAAFDIVVDALSSIRDFVKPIFDLFGWDITTSAFVVGLLRLTGILGIVLGTVNMIKNGLLGWGAAVAGSKGMTGLAAALGAMAGPGAAAGIATAAGGGMGMAAGGVAAGAAAARPSMAARAGSMAGRVLSRAALPVAIVDLGYHTGKGLGHLAWEYGGAKKAADRLFEQQVEHTRRVGDQSYMARHNRLMAENDEYQRGYWATRGVNVPERSPVLRDSFTGRIVDQPTPRETEHVRVTLESGGRQASGLFTREQANQMKELAGLLGTAGGR